MATTPHASLGPIATVGSNMLQISLLGDQRVTLHGASLAGSLSRRATEILAYLSLRPGDPQSRSSLAAAIWPDSTDAQALTNLRRELHHLRSVLSDGPGVTADTRTVCWQPSPVNRCDVSDFVQAEAAARASERADGGAFIQPALRAVAGYGGDLLPASTAEWVAPERDALHRQCVHLLDRLIAAEQSDAISQALEHAEQRLTLEPMQETSYRVLMRLQAAAGDRAAAIQTYHRCVAILDKELGVTPDAVTVALYGQLVASNEPRRPRMPQERRAPAEPRLVGRQHELADLVAWREDVVDAPPLRVVRGEAGMGKTRLIREIAARAASDGITVAIARCYPGPGRSALGPVAEWLGSDPLRARRHDLEPEWRAEVDRLLPPEAREQPRVPSTPMVDAWQRHHFFEGLARALLQPTGGTLLVLDDLQRSDSETLSWLPLFLELASGHPVKVLAGVRDEQLPGHPELVATLQRLRAAGLCAETEVRPLSTAATAELVESMLGRRLTPQDAARWHEATGGIPLFVIETARSKSGQEPTASEVGQLPRVQAVLRSRLEEASPTARDVATLAAAFGRAFPINLLSEASGHSENDIVDGIDELWRRRIIRGGEAGSYDFTHDLLRDAAYELISEPLRPLMHRRIAQAMELLADGETRQVAASLAEQYDRAQYPKRAIRNYALAAEDATSVFAYGSAVHRYARALELLADLPVSRERDTLELSLLHAMSQPLNALEGYASPDLRANLERSTLLSERLDEPRLRLLSLVALFAVRFVQGDVAESYRISEQALALSPAFPDAAGQAHFALGGAAAELGRHARAVEHFEIAHQTTIDYPPALVGTRPEVHARAWCAHPLWALGRDDEAIHWAEWAVARAEEVEQPYSLAVALAYAALTHQMRRDVDAARDYAERTIALTKRYRFAYYGEWGLVVSGWCLGGDAGAARIEEGLTSLREEGALVRHPYYLSLLAEVLLDAGDTSRAASVLDAALTQSERHEDRWWVPEVLRLKARTVGGSEAPDLQERALAEAKADGTVALLRRIEADL